MAVYSALAMVYGLVTGNEDAMSTTRSALCWSHNPLLAGSLESHFFTLTIFRPALSWKILIK